MKGYLIATGAILLPLGAYYITKSMLNAEPERVVVCTSELRIHSDNCSFSGVFKLRAAEGKGVVLVSGSYRLQSGGTGNLNRTVFFDYARHENMLDMVSNKITTALSDNARETELASILPPFYFSPATHHSFEMYKQADGYIITGTVLPFAYCLRG
ncbi:hypothetical protein [Serratia quinivorans]|uniref:hypothetical protein n=1 Tax=Serratia quinivorans TaxID=137545 RepID=UPI00217827B7|nr:hypothetical protein [Serratia quinivorans]CAI1073344.1 Uncharacterised protein [Serratia quinivorans]CAI1122688.1 Uncharacterised protein [Serratia quinivorans]CAI1151443.1 Uncharacterised protein [Serratia quinivorans]CAI1832508.1 Uncharacterised protein [Serratia quinivorans]CAI2139792.1 Uncharacterised protein [Serratia quinivorans]